MKTIEKLINGDATKLGNHRMEEKSNGIIFYIYHSTPIVILDNRKKTFITNNGGYNTKSTTRAINSYRRKLEVLGYVDMTEQKSYFLHDMVK